MSYSVSPNTSPMAQSLLNRSLESTCASRRQNAKTENEGSALPFAVSESVCCSLATEVSTYSADHNANGSAASQDEAMLERPVDIPECRMCLGSDQPDQLFMPCHCKGSAAFVHRHCLQKWRVASQNPRSYFQCDQCKVEYDIRRTLVADVLGAKWLPQILAPALLCYCVACTAYLVPYPEWFFCEFFHVKVPGWLRIALWSSMIVGIVVFFAGCVRHIYGEGFHFSLDDARDWFEAGITTITCIHANALLVLFLEDRQFWRALPSAIKVAIGLSICFGLNPLVERIPFKARVALGILMSGILAYSGNLATKTCVFYVAWCVGVEGFALGVEKMLDTTQSLCQNALYILELHVLDAVRDVRTPSTRVAKRSRNNKAQMLGVASAMILLLVVAPTCIVLHLATAPLFALGPSIEEVSPARLDAPNLELQHKPIIALWFLKYDSKQDEAFLEEYATLAAKMEELVKPMAIDCNKWETFCKESHVHLTPVLKIYVPGSGLSSKLPYRSKAKAVTVMNDIAKVVRDNSVHLETKWSIDSFFTKHPSKVKVVLFSSKTSPPLILKALSNDASFRDAVSFGFATGQSPQIFKGFKVSKFPVLVALTEDMHRQQYNGELTFHAIRHWLRSILLANGQD